MSKQSTRSTKCDRVRARTSTEARKDSRVSSGWSTPSQCSNFWLRVRKCYDSCAATCLASPSDQKTSTPTLIERLKCVYYWDASTVTYITPTILHQRKQHSRRSIPKDAYRAGQSVSLVHTSSTISNVFEILYLDSGRCRTCQVQWVQASFVLASV